MRAFAWGLLALALAALPAQAAPSGVYLLIGKEWNDAVLGAAIRGAFSRANIPLLAERSPDALIAAIPLGLEHDDISHAFQFTVTFSWHGVKLGESDESCNDKKVQECAPQFLLDTRSALDAAH